MKLAFSSDLTHRQGLPVTPGALVPPADSFRRLGGREAVSRLVDGLYDRIERDKVLRPAFGRDLSNERAHQKEFFEEWLGGDRAYFDVGWRPGLRQRHATISISRGMAGRWLGYFLDSLREVTQEPDLIADIKPIVTRLTLAFVNRGTEPEPGEELRRVCAGSEVTEAERIIRRDDAPALRAHLRSHPGILFHGSGLLLQAALRGKAGSLHVLVEEGVNPNCVWTPTGTDCTAMRIPPVAMTPLCGALLKGRATAAEALVKAGAVYDVHTAACLGDIPGLTDALMHVPDLVNAQDPACDLSGVTPLHHAVFAGQEETARFLLARGGRIGPNGGRLLESAGNAGRTGLVRLLLDHGASAQNLGAGRWVAYPEIADPLMTAGADVNRKPGAWIGLCCTGNSGHRENPELVTAFLRCGADRRAAYRGKTAIECATQAKFTEIIRILS